MNAKKNMVIVGWGGMGEFHSRYALKSDVVELLGIYDIDPARSEKARKEGIFAYDSYEAVLSDPRVDIVVIVTPNDHHKELAVAALNAKKHVITEKPAAMNSEELEEMIAAAKENGKLFSVHQNRRWDGDKIIIADLVSAGTLGRILSVESRVHGSRGVPGDWRKIKAAGGGMVLDWGVHLIDQAITMFPQVKVTSVYARLDHITTTEVDDGCHIVLGFENGVSYTIEVGTCNWISLPRFYVRGEQGAALIEAWNSPAQVVLRKDAVEKDAVPFPAQSGLTKTMAPRDADTTVSYEIPMTFYDVHDYYRNFCAAADGKAEQIVKHDEMRRVMKLMELIFESAEKEQVLHVEI